MILAAAADPTQLIQFGVLGIILALILVGWLWAKPSVDRLIEDKERAEAQRDALVEVYQSDVIPALKDWNDRVDRITSEVVPVLTEVKALLLRRDP
jgi:hypothetical protein